MKFSKLFSTVVLFLAFLFIFSKATFADDAVSKVYLSPSFLSVSTGSEFEVDVVITTKTISPGSDVVISYDDRVLELKDIKKGEAYEKLFSNSDKKGLVNITSLSGVESQYLTGTQRIATLIFKSIDAGDTSLKINFSDGNTKDTNVVSLDVRDTLEKTSDSSIQVGSSLERTVGASKRFFVSALPFIIFGIFLAVASFVGYKWWRYRKDHPSGIFVPQEIPMDKPPES